MAHHSDFYEMAEYYDLAFDFRNVPQHCAFISTIFRELNGRALASFLELGAGPAWYAIEYAQQGIRAAALDISPAMVAYGLKKAEAREVTISYHCLDMVDFSLDETFDCAALLLSTIPKPGGLFWSFKNPDRAVQFIFSKFYT
ncbi:class I SAM-dependent methyltransferase [bacterium]|nr:class I SAM-dependent methyltransferase [bacterium]